MDKRNSMYNIKTFQMISLISEEFSIDQTDPTQTNGSGNPFMVLIILSKNDIYNIKIREKFILKKKCQEPNFHWVTFHL